MNASSGSTVRYERTGSPNASILANQFEIAPKTAQRSIDFLRDRFGAPLEYNAPRKGYCYNDARYVVNALTDTRILSFAYTSPRTNETTRRLVEPHHLQNYMASWVLIAWCHSQSDWRKFYLSRMQAPELLSRTFTRRPRESWQPLLEETFGIFQGADPIQVTLQFTPFRARWIREQLWHPSQKITNLADGSLELSFPVADFREVKMKILQFGADVKVVQPAELREEIQDEILKMTSLYAP